MAICMPDGSFMGYPRMDEEYLKVHRLITDGTMGDMKEYLESKGGTFDTFDFLIGPNAGK